MLRAAEEGQTGLRQREIAGLNVTPVSVLALAAGSRWHEGIA